MKRIVNLNIIEKMLNFNTPSRYKLAYGGRGGGKSWSIAILLILKAIQESNIRILCTREVQNSIADSVHYLIKNCIYNLGVQEYFEIRETNIRCKNNSDFIFKGLRAGTELSDSIKSMENIKYCWVEEAQSVKQHSLDLLIPTIRNNNSEIWFSMNRKQMIDPVYEFVVNHKDSIVVKINYQDNPFLPDVLLKEAIHMKKNDYKLYMHIWEGEPLDAEGDTVLTRTEIMDAMNRNIIEDSMDDVIGIDVARFGDDDTIFVRRKGFKQIDHIRLKKCDIHTIASKAIHLEGNNTVFIVDDTGVGGGVVDILRKNNCHVIPVNNHSKSNNPDKFKNKATEMWFYFQSIINKIDIFKDSSLADELCTRHYSYNANYAKMLEPKEKQKLLLHRSPDYADALILCYAGNYTEKTIRSLKNIW